MLIKDSIWLMTASLHAVWIIGVIVHWRIHRHHRYSIHNGIMRLHDILLASSLFIFIGVHIFARNANLDYVQRFILTEGDPTRTLDAPQEIARTWAYYFPFVAANIAIYIWRVIKKRHITHLILPLLLLSGFLITIAHPSFLHEEGFGLLSYIALIPLLVAIELAMRNLSWGWGVIYGTIYGTFSTLLMNYWLITFNPISIFFILGLYTVLYAVFWCVVLGLRQLLHRAKIGRAARGLYLVVFCCCWVLFEYLRSIGFLGYPWGLLGHALYQYPSMIQLASVTGVWGISAMILIPNMCLAELVLNRKGSRRAVMLGGAALPLLNLLIGAIIVAAAPNTTMISDSSSSVYASSVHAASSLDPLPSHTAMRIALIQPNSHPRKHEYTKTLETLTSYTTMSLAANPDLVVWPETAYVPSIRRWGALDPDRHPYARLTHSLYEYLDAIQTPLITGNDDYLPSIDPQTGESVRLDYNAAVFFDAQGDRVNTYRKIKLVPFIEYFPYRDELPWMHDLLDKFDIFFWEPGDEYTVFHHPKARFSTPICFEDTFGNNTRKFVKAGAEIIINISNDYWSLEQAEARQHFAAALFRSVENRRAMARSTTSGVTTIVDRYGRIAAELPQYQAGYLVGDILIPEVPPRTLYTMLGDWFTALCAAGLLCGLGLGLGRLFRKGFNFRTHPK